MVRPEVLAIQARIAGEVAKIAEGRPPALDGGVDHLDDRVVQGLCFVRDERLPDIPRWIMSDSPESRSSRRYLPRRPTEVMSCSSIRSARSVARSPYPVRASQMRRTPGPVALLADVRVGRCVTCARSMRRPS